MPEPEEEPEFVEGPSPREWPAHAPGLWDLVKDLEHLERALAALTGPVASGGIREHGEAVGFLRVTGQQLRAFLAVEILQVYGLAGAPSEDGSPFEGAGKPRAFGAERPPDG